MSGTQVEEPVDSFQAAFDQLTALGGNPGSTDVLAGVEPTTPEPPVAEPAPAPAPEPEPEPEAAAAEPEPEPAPAPAPEPEPAKPTNNDDMLNRLADLVRARPEAPPAVQPTQSAQPAEIYSPEEKTLLAKYAEDWPDVVKAEALIRRAEYRDLLTTVYQEIAQTIGPSLQLVESLANRTHLEELRTAVPDYNNDIRDKVVDWVGKQPAYLRPAYEHVVKQGTPEEVADLISRYRSATGETIAAAPAAPVVKKDTELPPATKKAAAALAPVSSKRSAVIQGSDPGDFDAAFVEAAKSLNPD